MPRYSRIAWAGIPLSALVLQIAACTEDKPTRFEPRDVPEASVPDGTVDDPPIEEDQQPAIVDGGVDFVPLSTGPLDKAIELSARAGRIYVAEQTGTIRIVGADGSTSATALDIKDQVTHGYDQGLLGFTFHPQFPATPYLYVAYTTPHPELPPPANVSFQSVIARYESSDDGLTFSAETEKRIMVWNHPGVNHNNNALVFGADGYLYIASGEGGDPLDPFHAQKTDDLLGTILRIDVDGAEPYAIPPSNPFADGDGGLPEIFAYGLRNPWRFEFDAKSQRLFVGDVGQGTWEEINEVLPGKNYGWPYREGRDCYDYQTRLPRDASAPQCEGDFTDPLIVHPRSDAAAIVGGVVYHGTRIPELTGKYVYGDMASGSLWAAAMDSPSPTPRLIHRSPPMRAASIRLDESGEIIVAQYNPGKVFRMAPRQRD